MRALDVCAQDHDGFQKKFFEINKERVKQLCVLGVAAERFWDLAIHQQRGLSNRFAYTDGTTLYLARTWQELEDKQRAALGKLCWRMASGKDGLFDENVGFSMYAKAQGLPVKIWGLFANGRLEYHRR